MSSLWPSMAATMAGLARAFYLWLQRFELVDRRCSLASVNGVAGFHLMQLNRTLNLNGLSLYKNIYYASIALADDLSWKELPLASLRESSLMLEIFECHRTDRARRTAHIAAKAKRRALSSGSLLLSRHLRFSLYRPIRGANRLQMTQDRDKFGLTPRCQAAHLGLRNL